MIKGFKICGVSDPKTLKYILDHPNPPNFIGFITNYKKSKRFVEYEKLENLINVDKKNVKFVSVLVNPNNDILEKIKNLNFDYYQLYNVDPIRTKKIKEKYKKKIITALTINDEKDVNNFQEYVGLSEILLFDGKGYEKSVGFDHSLLNSVPTSLDKMIAGNIKIEDIPNLNYEEFFIDLSGSLENNEGNKDLNKINKLLSLAEKI
jgi:phosphoribosylanthranilate isomerase|tara:strand:+ start:1534 stop:2151 length:618 start_codon:yes stop_codon:yes gene_type:complete